MGDSPAVYSTAGGSFKEYSAGDSSSGESSGEYSVIEGSMAESISIGGQGLGEDSMAEPDLSSGTGGQGMAKSSMAKPQHSSSMGGQGMGEGANNRKRLTPEDAVSLPDMTVTGQALLTFDEISQARELEMTASIFSGNPVRTGRL